RRAGPRPDPAAVLLEERQVAGGHPLRRARRARLLGDSRLPQPRGSLARGALRLVMTTPPESKPVERKPLRWRPRLRALHRDVGYLLVGLTFVYAVSGLAVNHIDDWDPNFEQYERRHTLAAPLPDDEAAAGRAVLEQLGIDEQPRDVFLYEHELEIQLDNRSLYVDGEAMTILDRGQDQRRLLRLANWLHLNRGKKAWTIVARSEE